MIGICVSAFSGDIIIVDLKGEILVHDHVDVGYSEKVYGISSSSITFASSLR